MLSEEMLVFRSPYGRVRIAYLFGGQATLVHQSKFHAGFSLGLLVIKRLSPRKIVTDLVSHVNSYPI